ncbi:MAG: glycosyltransferase family 2 protein [Sphingomonadales bacterium]
MRDSVAANLLRAVYRRHQARKHVRDVAPVKVRPAARGEMLCFAATRDEMLRLPDFLQHYRALGVDRFVVVDKGSTDGSAAYLADQHDVDLFSTDASFSETRGGKFWLGGLARGPYAGCWGVLSDADEQLVYDGCERHGLHALARLLEARGLRSMPAMMIDMYPDGPFRQARLAPGQRLTDLCPLFDAIGYREVEPVKGGPPSRRRKYAGGARERLFSSPVQTFELELGKTPFLRWDRAVTLFDAHTVHPFALNFTAPAGALLHFKLMSDFEERAETAIRRVSHANSSRDYRLSLPLARGAPGLSGVWEGSRRYEGSSSLVEAGLMSAIDWP